MFGQINGVVARTLESCPGRDSICLDLCLNLNPYPASLPTPLHSPPLLLRPSVPPSSSSFLVLWRWAPGRGSPAAERSQARAAAHSPRARCSPESGPGWKRRGQREIVSSYRSERASAAGGLPGGHGGKDRGRLGAGVGVGETQGE